MQFTGVAASAIEPNLLRAMTGWGITDDKVVVAAMR